MNKEEFEKILTSVCVELTSEAITQSFASSQDFERRVRQVIQTHVIHHGINIDPNPPAQVFPDISIGEFGVEVKFTTNDTWRSVANSVLETNRDQTVNFIYLIFGKMGGTPEVRWADYAQSVIHVRTSHVPRFEVEISSENTISLFDLMGVDYDSFRVSSMAEKMRHIRAYARSRLKPGERLWWLDDSTESHSLPVQARLYTSLTQEEKIKLRAEAVLLSPKIVSSSRDRRKYDDVVMYLLTYHGVLAHQARDLFSAGSVANPTNDNNGGIYIQRSIQLIEENMLTAALTLPSYLFEEYWGYDVDPADRISEWLKVADKFAANSNWTPSQVLFIKYQITRNK